MNPSSSPVDARVAGADMSGNAQTNGSDPAENACPAGFDKLDDHGRGSFPENIESEWLRYLRFQEQRLKDAGEKWPHAFMHGDGTGQAGSITTPMGQCATAGSLHEAVTKRIELLAKYGVDVERVEKIAKLRAELATLKGAQ